MRGLRGCVWLREGGPYRAVRTEVELEDCDVIVMRFAGNGLGPIGGQHVSNALRELTGLQRLNLHGTCFDDFCSGCSPVTKRASTHLYFFAKCSSSLICCFCV